MLDLGYMVDEQRNWIFYLLLVVVVDGLKNNSKMINVKIGFVL